MISNLQRQAPNPKEDAQRPADEVTSKVPWDSKSSIYSWDPLCLMFQKDGCLFWEVPKSWKTFAGMIEVLLFTGDCYTTWIELVVEVIVI